MEWVVSGKTYHAPIQDLPCVTELYKTDERQLYHKCLDVGQVRFFAQFFHFRLFGGPCKRGSERRP